jgi:16S rRNA (uracil1498-N3)-methyltransferase
MRCFIPASAWSATRLIANEDEAHHLITVLRVKPGQPIEAFDGSGRVAAAEIALIQKHRVELRVLQQREVPRPPVAITLIQAVPREQKMDLVIQKAVELGVGGIVPVLTRHSLVRIHKGEGDAKRARWDKIAINAAKQCGAAWLPAIAPVQPLDEFLKNIPRYDLLFACSLEPDALPFKEVLLAAKKNAARTVAFLVGPEGDLNQDERAAVRRAGARPVSFGALVLRTETAALYALSVLKYELC